MNIGKISGLVLLAMSLSGQALALTCGSELIEGDEQRGMSMAKVKAACGEPDEVRNYGDDLVYKRDGISHVLHFNTEGILVSIQEE